MTSYSCSWKQIPVRCIVVLFMATSAQAAMLTSSVFAITGATPLTGTNTCANSGVLATCTFSGTALSYRGIVEPMEGTVSATPSLNVIDLSGSLTGALSNSNASAEAQVVAEMIASGPVGSGFVQYLISGDAKVGGDYVIPSYFQVQHGLSPIEEQEVSPNTPEHPVSLASQLYPVQFGDPFTFNWAASMKFFGTGAEQFDERFLRLELEILVFDSDRRPVTNAVISETPEPRSWMLSAIGFGVIALFRRRLPGCDSK